MSHLAEDSSVRRSNAFDCKIGAVRIVLDFIRYISVKIYILCNDLSVFCKLSDQLFRCNKSSFTVRNRNGINVARLCIGKPR